MANLSPKIEIINHFDNLIHQIDINIDETIEKYKEDQVLGKLKCFRKEQRYIKDKSGMDLEYFDSNETSKTNESETVIEWCESTKVIDYLTQIRQRTIDELKKVQEDSLENLKNKSCDLNHIKESKDVEEMRSRLFADKFYFQVLLKPKGKYWAFSLFTIVVDFYLSPTDINFLDYLINGTFNPESSQIFDEKFLLIHVLTHEFCKILKTQQYPSHLINFRKQDLLNIKSIRSRNNRVYLSEINFNCSSHYFSKLESLDLFNSCLGRLKMEGFSSLQSLTLRLRSIEKCFFGHMNSLRILDIYVIDDSSEINNSFLTNLVEMCPNIEELSLRGWFSDINFENFANLKKLSLSGYLRDNFNFKNMCNQLEDLSIYLYNMNDQSVSKFLYGQNLPNLSKLLINYSKITRLEKKLFEGFPMLQSLNVDYNFELTIDKDAFSNLKNLKELDLSFNRCFKFDAELFIGLVNLEKLHLICNNLKRFDVKIKDYIVNIKAIHLRHNWIENMQEILDHFKQSTIIF